MSEDSFLLKTSLPHCVAPCFKNFKNKRESFDYHSLEDDLKLVDVN